MSAEEPSTGPRRGLVGRVLGERYRITRVTSAGANTVVADAEDTQLGRVVTVKLIRPEWAESPDFRRRFPRAMKAISGLSHPHVAAVYDWGEEEIGRRTAAYAVIEHLTGGSLRDLSDRGRLLDPSQALVVGLEACRGLDYLHHHRIVHTELTPSKLVFGDDRRLHIVDTGLAFLLGAQDWSDPAAVATHVARYASPEQALGRRVDPKTDVYSLALILIEAVTGTVPFAARSTVATLSGRVGRLLPVSADLGPLASVLERAGRPEPAERSTAAEFGRGLVRAAELLPRPGPIPILSSSVFESDPNLLRRPNDPTGGVRRPPDPPVTPAVPTAAATTAAAGAAAVTARAVEPEPPPAADEPVQDTFEPVEAEIVEGTPDPVQAELVEETDELVEDEGVEETTEPVEDEVVDLPAEPVAETAEPVEAEVVGEPAAPMETGSPVEPDEPFEPPEPPVVPPIPPVIPPQDPELPPPPSVERTNGDLLVDTMPARLGQRRPRRWLAWCVAVVVVLALAGLGWVAYRLFRTPSHAVPELTGLTEADATRLTEGFEWEFDVELARSDAQPDPGAIIRTAPAAGEQLAEGEPFLIVVSEGPELRTLPELSARPLSDAETALAELRLVALPATEAHDEEVPPGDVVSWSIPANDSLQAGDEVLPETEVALVVSAGPAPRTIPELVGLTLSDATSQLESQQLVVAVGEQVFSDTVANDGVVSVEPAAGATVERGSTVQLIPSKGIDFVTMPDLTGQTLPQMQASLAAVGLNLGSLLGSTQGVFVSASVAGDEATPGAQYKRGTAIDLVLL